MPAHVAARVAADKAAVTASAFSRNRGYRYDCDDFISQEGVQDQLKLLQDYVGEERAKNPNYFLPKPSGWKLTILLLTLPETSAGGVHIIDETREAKSVASPQGVILALGTQAYRGDRFKVDGQLQQWHWVGDRIVFAKYDAMLFKLSNGQSIGMLNDTQPIALIDSGWEVPS